MLFSKKAISFVLALSIFGFCLVNSTSVDASKLPQENEISILEMLNSPKTTFYDGDAVITVTDSTKERYQKSLGSSSNQTQTSPKGTITPQVYDEVLKYKTLTSTKSIAGSSISTVIAVEVSYVYSNASQQALGINGIGNPYIRVSGPVTSASWDGSSPNVTWNSSSIRISYTGSAYVAVTKAVGVTLGSGWSLSSEVSTTQNYWSPVVTQVANFTLSQL